MAEHGTGPTPRAHLTVLRRRKWLTIVRRARTGGQPRPIPLGGETVLRHSELLVQSSGQTVDPGDAAQPVTTIDVQTDLQPVTSAPVVKAVHAQLRAAPAAQFA